MSHAVSVATTKGYVFTTMGMPALPVLSVCRARLEQVYNEEVRDLLAPGGSARPLEVSALAAGALPAGDTLGFRGVPCHAALALTIYHNAENRRRVPCMTSNCE